MKILLGNIPWKRDGRCGVRAGSRWPHIRCDFEKDYMPFPFFLAYSASLLKKHGFEVRLIDAVAEGWDGRRFLKEIEKFRPDLIVIETSTASIEDDLSFIDKIDARIPLALCGPDANIKYEKFLKERGRVNYILKGEYESTLLDLANHLSKNESLSDVAGINYRYSDGEVASNPLRPLVNLDELPWPMREGLPMEKYVDAPGGMPLPSVQMLASRGCPNGCIFCLWPQVMYQGRNYRIRDPKDVVDEMACLIKDLHFNSVYFDDDTFGLDRAWVLHFTAELKDRRRVREMRVPWAVMARADALDRKMLEEMKDAGLYAIKYGVESASQDVLDRSGKRLDIVKAREIIKLTMELGIKVHLTFMFGLPGETRDTINRTIDLALGLDPASVQFSIATPFPGTEYFDMLDKAGLLKSRRWADYDGNHTAVFDTTALSAGELKGAKDRAYAMWDEHCRLRGDYSPASLIKKTSLNIKILGTKYTLKKAGRYLKRTLPDVHVERQAITGINILINKTKHRLRNYINLMGMLNGSHAYIGPYLAQIDLTDDCNNNCIGCWCNSPLLDKEERVAGAKRACLSYEAAKRLIDELRALYTKEIYLAGGGEPFMHPDIMDIVRHIKKRNMVCYINTNFTLLGEGDIRRLVELGVDHMTVSVWAGNPKVYAMTHPNKDGTTFLRIKEMLKLMTSLRKKGSPPYIKLYNVISNLNYDNVEEMISFAQETGADSVEFTVIDTMPGTTDVLLLSDAQRADLIERCRAIKSRFRNSKDIALFRFDRFMKRLSDEGANNGLYDKELINSLPCYIGWVFTRILADGNVNACLKAHRMPIGNIHKDRFRDIWNGAMQKEFRVRSRDTQRSGSFFSMIGNDPNIAVGCYKGCDDLDRNLNAHEEFLRLSYLKRLVLKTASGMLGNRIISRTMGTIHD